MKYIKNPEFPDVLKLKDQLEKEGSILQSVILKMTAATAKQYSESIETEIKKSVQKIDSIIKNFCEESLPKGFHEGQEMADRKSKNDIAASKKKKAVSLLKKQGFRYADKSLSYDTYIEIHSACKTAGEDLIKRINEEINRLKKSDQDTVYNVKEAIKSDFINNGILTVKYSNGKRASVESYATMAARSARIESQNIGGIGRAIEHGTNLVKWLGNYPTCPVCAKYINKIFCIDGTDKRFPSLFGNNGPLKKGYALAHPNDRCEIVPWYEEFETKETVENAIKRSNETQKQSKTAAELYSDWQAQHRIERKEEQIFNEMKTFYGENMPYKTLSGFRHAYRQNPYNETMQAYRSALKASKNL